MSTDHSKHRKFFSRRLHWFAAAIVGVLLWGSHSIKAKDPTAETSGEQAVQLDQTKKPGTKEQPTILLTGFEPFGQARSANPSWEGVRLLDGQNFHEYRLVSRKMEVVWGEPIRQLSGWIDEVHPVAAFSFGQGGKGAFAIETFASNSRGNMQDNQNNLPSQTKIANLGPDSYKASIDANSLLETLTKKGNRVRISQHAGRYLCEECLYSLEHLRAEKKVSHVMFCHVPPFGTSIEGKKVTAELIRDFVLETLEAWYELQVKVTK